MAHPRSRGENDAISFKEVGSPGSSPLTRGKLDHCLDEIRRVGLIPAHAGKTNVHEERSQRPRGSSPLTRGKLRELNRWISTAGLIPAHAGKTGPGDWKRRTDQAHPRSRGENAAIAAMTRKIGGSSPLTRGKQEYHDRHARLRGLIPAHAGKTSYRSVRRLDRRAHPRSRGENVHTLVAIAHIPGSSPLTRGKPQAERFFGNRLGLIPAHAGKTVLAGHLFSSARAHPRSRGENILSFTQDAYTAGSSPLTRGKLTFECPQCGTVRLIPAHAGKTQVPTHSGVRTAAHPRSRGENSGSPSRGRCVWGSSPLTRGKHPDVRAGRRRPGLIPAHAGKTHTIVWTSLPWRAHPRSRGENGPNQPGSCFSLGSSPLTRGKPEDRRERRILRRLIPAHAGKTAAALTQARARAGSSPLTRGKHTITYRPHRPAGLIPAHAGKTSTYSHTRAHPRAHPRSRGENRAIHLPEWEREGSSPLTRGKRRDRHGGPGPRRLIPAHAGKTVCVTDVTRARWAHPRSRGENNSCPTASLAVGGSSPLTRGKRMVGASPIRRAGLIPAHAGKTPVAVAEVILDRGSSPLTRGKLRQRRKGHPVHGLIPAHAGKTTST